VSGLLTGTANAYIESNSINGTPYIGIKSTDVIGFNQDWRIQKAARGALGLGHYLSIYDVTSNVEKVNVFAGASGGVGIFTTTNAGYAFDINGTFRSGNITATNMTLNGGAITDLTLPGFRIRGFSNDIRLETSIMMGYISTSNNTLVLSNQDLAGSGALATSLFELRSNNRGFLPPRMTNAQRTAISSPAVGLIVYCTDATEGLYVYKSTGWTFVI
jgi:hypothetical protein